MIAALALVPVSIALPLSPTYTIGLVVAGFQLRLALPTYDAHAQAAGLELVDRWATWDRAPYTGGDYAVSIHRRV